MNFEIAVGEVEVETMSTESSDLISWKNESTQLIFPEKLENKTEEGTVVVQEKTELYQSIAEEMSKAYSYMLSMDQIQDQLEILDKGEESTPVCEETEVINTEPEEEEFMYRCAVCAKTFYSVREMIRHTKRRNHNVSNTVPPFVESHLPKVSECYVVYVSYDEEKNGYRLKLCIPKLLVRAELEEWMNQYMTLTGHKYVCKLHKSSFEGSFSLQKWYRCRYSYYSASSKKTNCKNYACNSTVFMSVSRRGFTIIKVKFEHNHKLSQQRGFPNKEVDQVLQKMFDCGLDGGTALRCFQNHILLQTPNWTSYLEMTVNKQKCPDLKWVQHVYSTLKERLPKLKPQEKINVLSNLQQFVLNLNEADMKHVSMCLIDEDDFVLVVITPLMFRVLEMHTAGELVFVYSAVDKEDLKVVLLLVKSDVGCLPIGVIIMSNNTPGTVTVGLNMYKSMLNEKSFGGKQETGPTLIVSDDSMGQLDALQSTFPNSKVLLCIYHMLHSVFKKLAVAENFPVKVSAYQEIYGEFKRMLFSQDEQEIEELYLRILQLTQGMEELCEYATRIYAQKGKWVVFCQDDSRNCGSHINKCIQKEINVIVDYMRQQKCKENVPRLVEYLLGEYEKHYVVKTLNVVFGNAYDDLFDEQVNAREYKVLEQTEDRIVLFNKIKGLKYLVHEEVGYCSCYRGVSDHFCRHQHLAAELGKTQNSTTATTLKTPEQKLQLYYVATGSFEILDDCGAAAAAAVATENAAPEENNGVVVLRSTTASSTNVKEDAEEGHVDEVVPVAESETTTELEDKNVTEARKSFAAALETLKSIVLTDPICYKNGMKSMTLEIQKLIRSSREGVHFALKNFNKNETMLLTNGS